jgi:hypothetical protein
MEADFKVPPPSEEGGFICHIDSFFGIARVQIPWSDVQESRPKKANSPAFIPRDLQATEAYINHLLSQS